MVAKFPKKGEKGHFVCLYDCQDQNFNCKSITDTGMEGYYYDNSNDNSDGHYVLL